MADDRPIHERMATIEARFDTSVPEIHRRLGVLETSDAEILKEVTAIKTMLQNNGFGKKNKDGNHPTIAQLKLETKVSRWITGGVIAVSMLCLGLLAVVVALVT